MQKTVVIHRPVTRQGGAEGSGSTRSKHRLYKVVGGQ